MSPPKSIEFVRDGHVEALVVSEVLVMISASGFVDENLLSTYRKLLTIVRPHITFFRAHNVVRLRPVSDYSFTILDDWLATPPSDRFSFFLELASGVSENSVGPYSLRLELPVNNAEFEAGYLRVGFPMLMGMNNPETMLECLVTIAKDLPVIWGQAGFSTEYDARKILPARDTQMAAWCARYRCLDHKDLDQFPIIAMNCVVSIGWLILIHKRFWPTTEPENFVLPDAVDNLIGTDLLILKAKRKPSLGDRNRNEDITGYINVFRALRNNFCKELPSPPGFDENTSIAWRQRFDEG